VLLESLDPPGTVTADAQCLKVGTLVLIRLIARQYDVNDLDYLDDLVGNGHYGLAVPQTRWLGLELLLGVAARSDGSACDLGENASDVVDAALGSGLFALPGGLLIAWRGSAPGGEAVRIGERTHVWPDLGISVSSLAIEDRSMPGMVCNRSTSG